MKNEFSEVLELSAATQEIKEKLDNALMSIQADYCNETTKDEALNREEFYRAIRSVHESIRYEQQYINSRINDLYSSFYRHTEDGHVPKLSGSAMTKLIKLLGLEDTYQIAKSTIYVSANDQSNLKRKELVIEYKK
jgi:hypothetical protein